MNAPLAYSADDELVEPIELTPFLALAVALLYMLMADGEIDDHESSQLQAVIGGNQDVLELAFEYVETVELDQFIKDAIAILSNEDKLCILCNLCDCLLVDGVSEQVEEDLFLKISSAFGFSQKSFSTYYSAISLKNEKSLLGNYDASVLDENTVTPHSALAASLLYMMAADGDIAEEEMGQLQVAIGEFEGLQAFAMTYVRNVKMNQFCNRVNTVLNADQKLLILANVCDSMMSDGKVMEIERLVFENMLSAFDITEKQFSPYYAPLEIKNFKPFGSDEEIKSLHTRKRTRRKGGGASFGMQLGHKKSNASDGRREVNDAANQGEWESEESQGTLSDIVTRTMQENIQQVSANFEDKDDVDRVKTNATEKLKPPSFADAGSTLNVQNIEETAGLANVQKIGANGFEIHRQAVGEGGYADNRQGLDFSGYVTGTPNLVSDNRVSDLQVNIGQVHEKLNRMTPNKPYEKNNLGNVESMSTATVQVPNPPESLNRATITHDWPELNFQPVEVAQFVKPQRKIIPSEALADGERREAHSGDRVVTFDPLPPLPESSLGEDTHAQALRDMSNTAVSAGTAVTADGFVTSSVVASQALKGRPLLSAKMLSALAAMVILPMGVYAYGQIYPTLVCQGQVQQSRFWTAEGSTNSTALTQDNRQSEMHRIEIRRGEVYLDNHRFPLYKELNQDNHIAAQTPKGFQGSYTTHAVENMSYAFDFNTRTQVLQLFTQLSGVRFIDGDVGQMRVVAVFAGQC